MPHEALLPALARIVGPAHVRTTGIESFESDWRGLARGRALAVVRPRTTTEVAQVVQACAAAGTPIVAQGGNTGLVGGSIPDASGREIVLQLGRMNTIRELDRVNATLTAEAGCILQAVQEAAAGAGMLFPLSLAAEGSCTIGGNLATNAGGTQVLRYGNARELCLGLEVVDARGEVLSELRGLRKDNTGYDLRSLFIGSEGTLGIVTAATLRLFPPPAARWIAWAGLPTVAAAVRLLGLAQRALGPSLTGFELMSQEALDLVTRHFPQQRLPLARRSPWQVLVEQSAFDDVRHARSRLESLLESALEDGTAEDVVVAENVEQGKRLWHLRESAPLAQSREGPHLKHDISVPASRITDFVQSVDDRLAREFPGARPILISHVGDGNLHYNVLAPAGADPLRWLEQAGPGVSGLVHDELARRHGSISAEHGIGAYKTGLLATHRSPLALSLMRSIKAALDPHNLLNPGRVLAAEALAVARSEA